MSHQVQNQEPPAAPPHIPDHRNKLLVAQVMRHADAHGYVRPRQLISHNIQLQNRKLPRANQRRPQIRTDHFHSQLASHSAHQRAVPTADIQNAQHRLVIVLQRSKDCRMVPEYAVREGKRPVRQYPRLGRHSTPIQNLCFKGTLHREDSEGTAAATTTVPPGTFYFFRPFADFARARGAALLVKLTDTPGSVRRPAPCHGEHTEEILEQFVRTPAVRRSS